MDIFEVQVNQDFLWFSKFCTFIVVEETKFLLATMKLLAFSTNTIPSRALTIKWRFFILITPAEKLFKNSFGHWIFHFYPASRVGGEENRPIQN
jgi:hypothetical protein